MKSFLGKRSSNFVCSSLQVGSRRRTSGGSHKSAFSSNFPVLLFGSCAYWFNTPLFRRLLSYLPFSPELVVAYPTVRGATRLRVLRRPIRLFATVSSSSRVGVLESALAKRSGHHQKLPVLVIRTAVSGGRPVGFTS